jgi:putative tryptophan/tyrosine transport system substrate-binding protein
MRRRNFIRLLAGAAAAWPCTARAQRQSIPTIGFLSTRSPDEAADLTVAFRQGLKKIGIVEGRNVTLDFRWANLQYDRLPTLAAELVRNRVTVIAAVGGIHSGLAAKAATSTIPVVFVSAGDPVDFGLVPSLSRPGGNITGISMVTVALAPKRPELLHASVPASGTIAMLVNPTIPYLGPETKDVQDAARALGREVRGLSRPRRTRHRRGVCGPRPTAGGGAPRQRRSVLRQPTRSAGRAGYTSCNSRHLPVA